MTSTQVPQFPEFKSLDLEDRAVIHERIWRYQPETSELTFTNFFIWRKYYHTAWSLFGDWLLVVNGHGGDQVYALPPIGPSPRLEPARAVLDWLREHRGMAQPTIERADSRLAEELRAFPNLESEPIRDHFDYIYRSEDLSNLAGRKYHAKRNHVNRFLRTRSLEYRPLTDEYISRCLELTESWCELKHCVEDQSLLGEWEGLREALTHFRELQLHGGMILLGGKVEAVSLGELLNRDTAVIHIEKANPEIDGLYAVINQQFAQVLQAEATWINREQDLGEAGLRKAKLSYFPDHLVEKFKLRWN
jgi:uncharacterized protein